MYYTEYITVVFVNWKGERVEIPWSAYMPFDTVSNISEQIGDLQ